MASRNPEDYRSIEPLRVDPQLLENREAYKHQFGRSRLVAFWSALITLLREHRQLHLSIEGNGDELKSVQRDLRTPTLLAGNNRLPLEQIGIPQAPLVEHGQLAAIALEPVGTLAMLWLLVRGAFGTLGDAERIINFAFDRITVTPALRYGRRLRGGKIKVATDGEIVWLKSPLDFRVAQEPLYLVKPDTGSGTLATP